MKSCGENWGGAYEENMSKILSAVRSTDGQYLSYGGEAIEAVFHSSSAGKTEDSAELWSARPYLVSVDSPETAEDVPNYVTTVTVPCEDFAAKLSSLRPGADFSGEPALWLGPAGRGRQRARGQRRDRRRAVHRPGAEPSCFPCAARPSPSTTRSRASSSPLRASATAWA